jgi:hypothetical protein
LGDGSLTIVSLIIHLASVGYVRGVPEGCLAVVTSLSCEGEGGIAPAVCGEDCFEYKGISLELWELLASIMKGEDKGKANQTAPVEKAVNGKKVDGKKKKA